MTEPKNKLEELLIELEEWATQSLSPARFEDVMSATTIIRRQQTALNDIASWEEGEDVTSSFDEPASSLVARFTLADIEAGLATGEWDSSKNPLLGEGK